jgi:hypothetical protein
MRGGAGPGSDLRMLFESEGMGEISKHIYEHTVIIFIIDTFTFSQSSYSLKRLVQK